MSSHNRPNILFILTDQFRSDCIAALGNDTIKTPNLDRLVRQGTTFTNCYTPSPVCCPARRSLTCGQPPHITGCVDNVEATEASPSFMEELADEGYQTHGIGKMHFSQDVGDWGFQSRDVSEELEEHSDGDDYRDFLVENGYEHVLDPHGLRSEFYYLPQPSQLPTELHNTHWVADKSIAFLENRDRSKPFFLWSSFIKPHPPFESPNPWGRLYRMHEMDFPLAPNEGESHWTFWNRAQNRFKYAEGFADNRNLSRIIKAAYYGTISFIDYNIGRILDSLGSEIENTVVIFSSDHGELLGDFGCYGKRSMLNASVKVPLIASLPGTFPEKYLCNAPTSLLDLFPTFQSLSGSSLEGPSCEGKSLLESLESESDDRIVFSQFSQSQYGLYMAASKRWKYIYSAADNKQWLFDLVNDPNELIDLSEVQEFATQLETMKSACIQRFRSDEYYPPIDGNDWRRYPKTELPVDTSDDGLLFQDPPGLDRNIETLGAFARSTEFKKDPLYSLLNRLCDASEPEELSPKSLQK
ncbi:MAG: sulfatase-like hydrolase/transferase [Verrucomicrobiota bacterium]